MCVRVFSVGFGPGLDSMSPARSRRSASHVAGTHGWLPQKTGRRGRWIQFAQCSPEQPPTVAHQPRVWCITRCSSCTSISAINSSLVINIYMNILNECYFSSKFMSYKPNILRKNSACIQCMYLHHKIYMHYISILNH